MKSSLSLAKIWFILSFAALSFGYGFVSHAWGLFPKAYMEQAWRQAQEVLRFGTHGQPPLSQKLVSQVYERSGTRWVEPDKTQPGLTLITSLWKRNESDSLVPGARLIDHEGRIVHGWYPDREKLFQGFNLEGINLKKADFDGSYLFPNGDLILILEYIGAVRVNACGDVLWRLKEGNHHYFSRAEDGSFWMPGTSSERRTETEAYPDGFPGIDKPVWLDQVLHVTEDGDVLKKINVLDILYENGLERHIVKAHGSGAEGVHSDVVHLNDVEPLSSTMENEYPFFEAGDLLVSLRRPSLVFVFDPDSRKVKWHASRFFLRQHDPDFIGGGWIGVFDNNTDFTERGTMLGGSRIVAIQPHTDSTNVLFPTQRSDPFYTSVQGQWQRLKNENMLLVERDAGRVIEVAPSGQTVWEWIHRPHGDSKVPIVTGAHRYDMTRMEVASWPCSSVDSTRTTIRRR